jgi:hypothetical protein
VKKKVAKKKTLKKPKQVKKKKTTKKIKLTIKKKKKTVKNITVKKKRKMRCSNGTRWNSKTGKCEPKDISKKPKKPRKVDIDTHIIESIRPDLVDKSLHNFKSFSPDVNKKLKSLQTYTPELGLFGCKPLEISIDVKGKRKCVKWNSKTARDKMMLNLTAKTSSSKKFCNNIVAPKQVGSNCWFNCFFMVFFISDKGRKFTRYLRQIMITGKRLNGNAIDKKLKWPFFLLNKCIEASFIGNKTVAAHDFAYLMDTNDIIKEIYENLPKSLKKKTKDGLHIKINENYNPILYYKGMVNYLDSNLKTNDVELKFDWFGFNRVVKKVKKFEEIISERFSVGSEPDFMGIDVIGSNSIKPLQILVNNKVKYVLDSVVLRDTKGHHFSAYITCGGKEYGFDGESHARMQPFIWKNKLNKNTQWRFAEQHETFFNFNDGYMMLFYYRI